MSAPMKPAGFDEKVRTSMEERRRVRTLVDRGKWLQAEPDETRARAYSTARRAERGIDPGRETLRGTDDLQSASFLAKGAQVRRAVAYVEVHDPRGSGNRGSGFLISPRLLLTNAHVIPDRIAAENAFVSFDMERDVHGRLGAPTDFRLRPDVLGLFSDETTLDYALIALGEATSGNALVADFGCCPLSDTPDRHVVGMPVNIIQHPQGMPKMVAVRNNLLTHRTERTLLYETDTETGSSGAPVFNDRWELIALHHWGQPALEKVDEFGQPIPTHVNEGVRISAIYRDLRRRLPSVSPAEQQILQAALAPSASEAAPSAGPAARKLGPPRPENRSESASFSPTLPFRGLSMSPATRLTVRIPIDITVSVGDPASPGGGPQIRGLAMPADVSPVLRRGAESMQLDADYDNRSGYEADFVSGINAPFPTFSAALDKQVAPLRAGQGTDEEIRGGLLTYEHFSMKMHRQRRVAIVAAVNIDGEQYLEVDRKSGEVAGGAEGDRWFKDARISETFWIGQDFYSEWSTYFDRGHVIRRTYPTWGADAATAERANADTFHWTNCSPQHFRFNQSSQFWQGAERYVLENGLLARDQPTRLSVFVGPIFSATEDRYADDVQIPSSFFKVIFWRGAAGPQAVGLVVSQADLLDEAREFVGTPKDLARVTVNQFRVPITTIEKRTGIDFGDAVRAADTIGQDRQPNVGESDVAIPLRSLSDVVPRVP